MTISYSFNHLINPISNLASALSNKFPPYGLLIKLVAISVLSSFLSVAHADETTELTSGILIEEAVLHPAKKGERARLRFKIINLSTRNISLLGIRAAVSRTAVIKMKLNGEDFQPVDEVSVLREETLDLVSSHIKIELVDLLEDVRPNTKIKFDVVFSDFETSAIADVH